MSYKPLPPDDLPAAQLTIPPQPTPVAPSAPVASKVSVEGSSHIASSGPALDEAMRQDFLWHTHQYLSEQARFCDAKAAFAGAIAAALLGGLHGAKAHVPLLQAPYSQWSIATWLALVGSLLLSGAILLAIGTVFPRLRSTQAKGFVFWSSITAYGSFELLRTSFQAQSADSLSDHLLHHVFDIATEVCVPKFRTVSWCVWALVAGSFLAAAALLLGEAR